MRSVWFCSFALRTCVVPFASLCVVLLVLLTNTLPTTVGTYMRALYSMQESKFFCPFYL